MASEDDAHHTIATKLPSLPPVETQADLPADAESGAICFVKSEQRSYVFDDGGWRPRGLRSKSGP